jgi:hypothetical protein
VADAMRTARTATKRIRILAPLQIRVLALTDILATASLEAYFPRELVAKLPQRVAMIGDVSFPRFVSPCRCIN